MYFYVPREVRIEGLWRRESSNLKSRDIHERHDLFQKRLPCAIA